VKLLRSLPVFVPEKFYHCRIYPRVMRVSYKGSSIEERDAAPSPNNHVMNRTAAIEIPATLSGLKPGDMT
jgi:hypothetical protein